MEANSVRNHTSDQQNRTTTKLESDLLIKSLITDRIGRHEVLFPVNHKYSAFRRSSKGHKAGEKFGKFSIL